MIIDPNKVEKVINKQIVCNFRPNTRTYSIQEEIIETNEVEYENLEFVCDINTKDWAEFLLKLTVSRLVLFICLALTLKVEKEV